MRTTLTIEPDVAQEIRQRMAEKKLPLKRVVNDALRAGLSKTGKKERTKRFVVKPWPLELKPGIDRDKLGQLLDQLETEEFIRKMSE
ncbi:MAG: DUF2191 domain-containing protein [Bryobacteraceae bacterium]|jgi:hypothetical protein